MAFPWGRAVAAVLREGPAELLGGVRKQAHQKGLQGVGLSH